MAITILLAVTAVSTDFTPKRQAASAASTNLITNSSFEGNIDTDWIVWKNGTTQRNYTFFRSYESPFGFGSYSGAISAQNSADERFSAGLVTDEAGQFLVEAEKDYYFSFYARASENSNISFYLEKTKTYEPVTMIKEASITADWQKYDFVFTPDVSGPALLNFVFGDLPADATLYLDGLSLFENNIIQNTKEVSGFIGDQNKLIGISNISNFSPADITIELPYYDETTSSIAAKKIHPKLVNSSGIYFDFEKGTFSGIGTISLFNEQIGRFNYVVTPKITEYNPSLIRVDEDLAVYGSGFNPNDGNTFAILNAIDINGKKYETWIKPHSFDSQLSQIVIKLPFGVANGKLYIYTSFLDTSGADIKKSSNVLTYSIKPSIHKLEWSKSGYEQVGDKLRIYGKGISDNSYINFYDTSGKQIISTKAIIKEIGTTTEAVEVVTPKNANKLNLTVRVGSVESDKEQALELSAKPKLNLITTSKKRTFNANNTTIAAAKIGETIRFSGDGLSGASSTVFAEFQGDNERIRIEINPSQISSGKTISVAVPEGALTGFCAIEVNGQKSNHLPLEVIPTVISISPESPIPGKELIITAQGVGRNTNLAKIFFNLTDNQTIVQPAASIDIVENKTIIKTIAPLAISNKHSSITLQYDNWKDDNSYAMRVQPQITEASLDTDTKILSIKGYGFSIHPQENKITYQYADHTVINPKVTILGVYPTEEGQEIRIKINDGYYYGHVQVSVDNIQSNEANFGPAVIKKITRRVQYVASENDVMGVLYISGNNFGDMGDIKIGDIWAKTHYRSNFFIIAVVSKEDINKNPVIITKQ